MKKKIKKKILVPVDGSDRALNTVRYIARNDQFHKMDIVLLHVFSSVPEGYWDMEKDPRSTSTVRQVRAWEVQQKKKIQSYMQQASQFLLKAGFSSESIKIKIQNRKKGIARDIIREAKNGYSAVVTRRRGMTGMQGIVLGSVATKLVEKLSFLPIVLVGRKPANQKILLAFDGSGGALHAVDFVGSILAEFNFEVSLIHVIRGNQKKDTEFQQVFSSKKYTEITRKEMSSALKEAKTKLIDMGFKPDQVSTEIITGSYSRARTLTEKAKQEEYGTIVMGRRGHSRVRDFFIGRVTNKVIHLARDRTIWVIR
ncbi:MAG: universal stress protein [Desulfobacteraceae bacterium]|jgi:nucleotide-binding universal stress UspA family protein